MVDLNMRNGYTVAVYFPSDMAFQEVLAFMRLTPEGALASGHLGDPFGIEAEHAEIEDQGCPDCDCGDVQ